MIKLLALGALGYVGYRFLQDVTFAQANPVIGQSPVAGGPLSENASVQQDPSQPPAHDPYADRQ